MIHRAKVMGVLFEQEDGAEGAVQAFYKHLPLENMICDISIFSNEAKLATVRNWEESSLFIILIISYKMNYFLKWYILLFIENILLAFIYL